MTAMKLYIVEGEYDTDLEGMVFAVCTSKEKADKAMSQLFDGEDLHIAEVIANTIITNGKIVEL